MIAIEGYARLTEIEQRTDYRLFKGQHITSGLQVLLKFYPAVRPSESNQQVIIREYRELKNLASPNLIQVIDMGIVRLPEHKGSYIAFLTPAGIALQEYIKQRLPLLPAEAVNIAEQVLSALRVLHQNNICYNEVYPHHIYIHPQSGHVQFNWSVSSFAGFFCGAVLEQVRLDDPKTQGGILPYLAPEQTGRTNAKVDYRADFYSLGAILFELLTGKPPFTLSDPMELIHAHIARPPVSPAELRPEIPGPLGQIILKLLAKTPNERYQSIFGLQADLKHCRRYNGRKPAGAEFIIGLHDAPQQFRLKQGLYGREAQVARLLNGYQKTQAGRNHFMLLTGYPGIGKSRLVHEIQRPVMAAGGYFISGKYDHFQQNVPYSAIIQAFQGLIRRILVEDAGRIKYWKKMLLEALGMNGRVIATVIPEIELIIGPQPLLPDLPSSDAQNRFHMICERFVNVFARKEHPLVIFLDDLQWADTASIRLMKRLFLDAAIQCCYFIGAYRHKEISSRHPFIQLVSELELQGFTVEKMLLDPLNEVHIRQLLADSFSNHIQDVKGLAAVIYDKTRGNPFFVRQFLQSLHSKKNLAFDFQTGAWHWNKIEIHNNRMTDNVIELMTDEIRQLPPPTQELLKLAACIGNRFDLRILSIVSQTPPEETAARLILALDAGLILAQEDIYPLLRAYAHADQSGLSGRQNPQNFQTGIFCEFLHDRVRQSAYGLVPIPMRRSLHFKIGKLMLNSCDAQALDANIFSIVNHLNYGLDFFFESDELRRLAELNLTAGKRAKNAAAYSLALSYINTGIALLNANCWDDQFALAFGLYKEKMECAYLDQDLTTAEEMFQLLITRAKTALDKAGVSNLKMVMCAGLADHREALAVGLEGLRFLGVKLRAPQNAASAVLHLLRIRLALRGRQKSQLLNLPEMQDPRHLLVMEMLLNLSFSAYLCNPYLTVTIAAKIIAFTLKYGNSPASALGYAIYGAAMYVFFQAADTSSRFGKIALNINQKFGRAHSHPKIYLYYGSSICPWYRHLRHGLQYNHRGFRAALETGDRNYAVYHLQSIIMFQLAGGTRLTEIEHTCQKYMDFVTKTQDSGARNYLISVRQAIKCLRGATQQPFSLDDPDFQEKDHLQQMLADNIPVILMRHHLLKTKVLCIMGDYAGAFTAAIACQKLARHHIGTIVMAELLFYLALTMAARYPEVKSSEKRKLKRRLSRLHAKLCRLAERCRENFQHHALLIGAELACIQGRDHMAMGAYQAAVQSAETNGFRHIKAMAAERAAKFYKRHGLIQPADQAVAQARADYLDWGATAKADALLADNPHLLAPKSAGVFSTTQQLDYAAVVSALQTISTEIVPDKLLQKLIKTCLQNAGAQKAVFLLNEAGSLYVIAAGSIDNDTVEITPPIPLEQRNDVLVPLINYVNRTKQYKVLEDAARQHDFGADPYVLTHHPKSILCLPVLRLAKLVAILYLENNITSGVFTPARIQTLELLASQAAISFENARLYDRLSHKEKDLRELSDKLRSLSSEIVLTEERERRRIAVELHDRIGHALTNIRIQLGLLQTAEPAEQKKISSKIQALVDQSIQDAHTLTFELSPPVLYDLGLEAALEWLAYQTQEQHGIEVKFMDDNQPKEMDESIRLLIFQAARELLFNVVKHAGARHALISLQRQDRQIILRIEDDGVGISRSRAAPLKQVGGFGLFSIQERLKLQGGRLTIESPPQGGTSITLISPLACKQEESG